MIFVHVHDPVISMDAPIHKSSTDLREANKKILSQRDEVLHFRDVFTNEANLKHLMEVYFCDVITRPTHREIEQTMS